jgi:hypothetical protein
MLSYKKMPFLLGLILLIVFINPLTKAVAADNTVYQLKVYHYKTAAKNR